MSRFQFDRRDFLKVLGVGGTAALAGCDLPSTRTIEEGKEDVVSYLSPEEFNIPGVGVYYASTCQQCSAGCGIHGRVREGRVLKFEGNPNSGVGGGKLCQMGQAALQTHYHPDRITAPMMRQGGALKEVSWEDAMSALAEKTGPSAGVNGNRVAWVTRTVSGHQRVLIDAYLEAAGSSNHYVQEMVNDSAWQAAAKDMLGDANPKVNMDKAALVLSIGDDFLGASTSPVANSRVYAEFRSAPRGMLVQAEAAMSLTGANADLWIAIRPGTEAALVMGIANVIARKGRGKSFNLTPEQLAQVEAFDMEKAADITGVAGDRIVKAAALLMERSPSVVIAGGPADYEAASAAILLNIMLGNVGNTIEAGSTLALPQLEAKTGSTRDHAAFAEAVSAGKLDVVFINGANPVYETPASFGLDMSKIGFKVAFSTVMDETTETADLVLPVHSAVEDFGTHVSTHQSGEGQVSIQQPLMEPVHAGTRGFGDMLLALLKLQVPGTYDELDDYYGYLRNAFAALPEGVKGGASDDDFWDNTLAKGVLKVGSTPGTLSINARVPKPPSGNGLALVPSARLGIWDGRHADLPWMQEAPDQISKIVWDSFAAIHPVTAEKLGVVEGDTISVSSASGSFETRVYVFKGVHTDAVAVPMGQGHTAGRYAAGVGVNSLAIMDKTTDDKTGDLAMAGTSVKLAKTGKANNLFAKLGDQIESQHGRKIVGTVTATRFQRTEGGA